MKVQAYMNGWIRDQGREILATRGQVYDLNEEDAKAAIASGTCEPHGVGNDSDFETGNSGHRRLDERGSGGGDDVRGHSGVPKIGRERRPNARGKSNKRRNKKS